MFTLRHPIGKVSLYMAMTELGVLLFIISSFGSFFNMVNKYTFLVEK